MGSKPTEKEHRAMVQMRASIERFIDACVEADPYMFEGLDERQGRLAMFSFAVSQALPSPMSISEFGAILSSLIRMNAPSLPAAVEFCEELTRVVKETDEAKLAYFSAMISEDEDFEASPDVEKAVREAFAEVMKRKDEGQ